MYGDKDFPESGSIEDLPQEFVDEFLDKINHIKREGMWEKFKEVGEVFYSDIQLRMVYSEGSIICFKLLNEDEMVVYHIPFEDIKEGDQNV